MSICNMGNKNTTHSNMQSENQKDTTTVCPKVSRLSTELTNSTQNSNKCRTNKDNCTLNDLTGFSYQFAPHYNFPNTHVIHGNRASPHCLSATWATKTQHSFKCANLKPEGHHCGMPKRFRSYKILTSVELIRFH